MLKHLKANLFNPVKYAEIFSTKSNSSSPGMKQKIEKAEDVNASNIVHSATQVNCTKEVQDDDEYILNEHTGVMEK